MSVVHAELVRHEPKWTAPVVLVRCPSCGRECERSPGAWSMRADGSYRLRMSCWPIGETDPLCYRTFDAIVDPDGSW